MVNLGKYANQGIKVRCFCVSLTTKIGTTIVWKRSQPAQVWSHSPAESTIERTAVTPSGYD